MRSLYFRIYLTVLTALALFALVSGMAWQHYVAAERERHSVALQDRMAAWGDLVERALPGPQASADEQSQALKDWSRKLRLPMALDDAQGRRLATSEAFARREEEGRMRRPPIAVRLDDGRTLWMLRPGMLRGGPVPPGAMGEGGSIGPVGRPDEGGPPIWRLPLNLPGMGEGAGLVLLLALLFLAVAAGAWPVVRHLTRQLEALKQGVEAFGKGDLNRRVPVQGRDEVAAVATSFNQAAARIQALMQAHKTLLANASHELRSPLARLKMATAMRAEAAGGQQAALDAEIHTNIRELDQLVEEVLMSSRIEAGVAPLLARPVELLALAAEEAAKFGVQVAGVTTVVNGDERLLRRLLRNLLENAHRYGGEKLAVEVQTPKSGGAQIVVSDDGKGVPIALRERIFEPFFRVPGHGEQEGGIGLGLALVRQIAQRHGGEVRCEPGQPKGTRFVVALPPGAPGA
jgi:signal transduction histidine kinase